MHDKCILGDLKVQINLHAAVMGVAGHGVPYTARFQMRHTHFQLAALYLAGKDILANGPVIGLLQTTQLLLVLLLDDHNAFLRLTIHLNENGGAGSVRRCAVDVELRGICGIDGLENDILLAHPDVHSVTVRYGVFLSVYGNDTVAADIDDAHLAALKEIFRTKLISCFQLQFLIHRSSCSCDDPVDVAVNQADLILEEYLRDQEFLTKSFGCIKFRILRGCCCS